MNDQTTTEPTTEPTIELDRVELGEQVGILRDQIETMRQDLDAGRPARSPFADYPTSGHYWQAVRTNKTESLALVDQITPDNPGVVHPHWLRDIKAILDARRRFIAGTGGPAMMPSTGMQINWPTYTGDLTTGFGVQTAQKTAVASEKISIGSANADVVTLAIASDISVQLLERSDPGYLDAYNRIIAAKYGVQSDILAIESAELAATGAVDWTGTEGAAGFAESVAEAAQKVDAATGAPPTIVAVAASEWVGLAAATASDGRPYFPAYGRTNTAGGTTEVGALAIDVWGIRTVPVARSGHRRRDRHQRVGVQVRRIRAASSWTATMSSGSAVTSPPTVMSRRCRSCPPGSSWSPRSDRGLADLGDARRTSGAGPGTVRRRPRRPLFRGGDRVGEAAPRSDRRAGSGNRRGRDPRHVAVCGAHVSATR